MATGELRPLTMNSENEEELCGALLAIDRGEDEKLLMY
jgi:hypothetical protein